MRELRAGAAIIILALVVAACGDTPPTPAPSGSTAPDASVTAESAPPASAPVSEVSPEPPPVDVALAAADALADPQLETTVTVDATTKVGKTTTHTTGTIDVAGRDRAR